MTIKQISIFLENQSGKLAELASCLSESKIDLRAISVAEASDFGIVRIIVDDVFNATTILKNNNYVCSLTDVLAVEVSDEPGSLAGMIAALGTEGINLEYMYAITAKKHDVAYMIVRVADTAKASDILDSKGFRTVDLETLAK